VKKVARTNGNYEVLMRELDYPLRYVDPEEVTGTTRLNHDEVALVMLGYFQQLVRLFNKQLNKEEDNNGEERSDGTD